MKNVKIQIPNMQSAHCQMRVRNAINSIEGITINEIEPGLASITVENGEQQNGAIREIEKAGYTVQQVDTAESADEQEDTFYFETNINCGGCVKKVSSALDTAEGICHWNVDTNSQDKRLMVHSTGITKQEVMDAVRSAGFNIEEINS